MLYSKIISTKYSSCFKLLSLILIASLIITLTSCETVNVNNYTPDKFEKLEEPSEYTVIELATKDTTLNTSSCEVKYFKGNAETPSLFKFEKIDSILAKDISSKAFRFQKKEYEIMLSDLKNIKTRDVEFNWGKTLMWSGIVIGVVLVFAVLSYIASPPKFGGLSY